MINELIQRVMQGGQPAQQQHFQAPAPVQQGAMTDADAQRMQQVMQSQVPGAPQLLQAAPQQQQQGGGQGTDAIMKMIPQIMKMFAGG